MGLFIKYHAHYKGCSTFECDKYVIYENLMIECNVIHSAYITGVKRLLFLGSSCIYPKLSKQPIKESELLDTNNYKDKYVDLLYKSRDLLEKIKKHDLYNK